MVICVQKTEYTLLKLKTGLFFFSKVDFSLKVDFVF